MSEQYHSPENQPSTPDQQIAFSGLSRVVDGWRRWRIGQLENTVNRLEDSIEQADSSLAINQNTGRYARIENVAFGVKEPTASSTQVDRDAWVVKNGHESKITKVADDGTVAESLRPVTKSEQRLKRSVERAEAHTVRPAGVIDDLHKIYDLPDKDAIAARPDIPDRRPKRGNAKARALVDESLRRANLLNDQPPRDPEPKVRLGTPEHQAAVVQQRLQEGRTVRASERKRLHKAERTQRKQQRIVTRKVTYVENVANSTDRKANHLDRKINRTEKRIAKKQQKIVSHAAKLS